MDPLALTSFPEPGTPNPRDFKWKCPMRKASGKLEAKVMRHALLKGQGMSKIVRSHWIQSSLLLVLIQTKQISAYFGRTHDFVSHSRRHFLRSAGFCQPHSHHRHPKSAHVKSYGRKWKAPVYAQQQYLRNNARSEPEVGLCHSWPKYVDGEFIATSLSHYNMFLLQWFWFFESRSSPETAPLTLWFVLSPLIIT